MASDKHVQLLYIFRKTVHTFQYGHVTAQVCINQPFNRHHRHEKCPNLHHEIKGYVKISLTLLVEYHLAHVVTPLLYKCFCCISSSM